jgi:hypothetical protein
MDDEENTGLKSAARVEKKENREGCASTAKKAGPRKKL